MKLFIWNINQRSSGNDIPKLVSEEILKDNEFTESPDIIVLTEFLGAKYTEKIKRFKELICEKYLTFVNEERDKEKKANGICIAVKKGFAEINGAPIEKLNTSFKEENQPNFLQVESIVNGKPVSIIGTRIRVNDELTRTEFLKRRQQLLSLVEHIIALGNKNIIVAGDFNNAYIRD